MNFPYLDSNIPRNPAYGVYISQLVRYARICSRKDDFIYRHRRLSLKLQQQGYKYQQHMKSFHKFYRSHSDELKKFGTTLMELRSSIWKEVLVEYILLNYIWTYFWCVRGCVSFTVLCVICCARVFLFFVRACLYHCDVYSADVGRILYINGYYFIFLAYTNVCSVTELT